MRCETRNFINQVPYEMESAKITCHVPLSTTLLACSELKVEVYDGGGGGASGGKGGCILYMLPI